jgi:hypothetical protein
MKSIQIKLTEQGVSTETLLAVQSALDLDKHDMVLSDRPGATVTYRPAGPSAKALQELRCNDGITLRRARAARRSGTSMKSGASTSTAQCGALPRAHLRCGCPQSH